MGFNDRYNESVATQPGLAKTSPANQQDGLSERNVGRRSYSIIAYG